MTVQGMAGTSTVATSFETRVAAALADLLRDQARVERLVALQRLLGSGGDQDPSVEKIILRTLVVMVHQYDPFDAMGAAIESFILEGLLQSDRWRTLLDTETNARAFVIMLSHHLDSLENMRPNGLRKPLTRGDLMVRKDVIATLHTTLATWLGFDTKADVRLRAMASKLFGGAWYTLVIDGYSGTLGVAELITNTHPPFMPGWVRTPDEQPTVSLPSLE